MSEVKVGDIVTLPFDNLVSSNTFLVDDIIVDKKQVLLKHPLFPEILLKADLESLNSVQANLKDSTERSLDFVNKNKQFLDYNTMADLDALCAYFVVRRKLTPRQKHTLARMCGKIASIKLNENVEEAKNIVNKNSAVLDDFNTMWYRNFSKLFYSQAPITSRKQSDAIFNMAGFVMAELETPSITK